MYKERVNLAFVKDKVQGAFVKKKTVILFRTNAYYFKYRNLHDAMSYDTLCAPLVAYHQPDSSVYDVVLCIGVDMIDVLIILSYESYGI